MFFSKFVFSENWPVKKLDKINFWSIFFIVSLAYWGVIIFSENFIFTNDFYATQYGQISKTMLESVLDFQERFWWIDYFLKSLFILTTVGFSCLCILVGAIFNDTEFSIHSLFKVTLIAYSIFIFSDMWFLHKLYMNLEILSLETIADFYPLTILSIYGTENVVQWLHYPLQTLNLFEVAYILCVSWLLSKQWKPDFIESINIVLPSYGIGLLIWMVLVVFLTLQVS